MRQVDQALTGIKWHSYLSCRTRYKLALGRSDIAKHNVLACYNYNTHEHFRVLTRVVSLPSYEDSPLAGIDTRFENLSARSENVNLTPKVPLFVTGLYIILRSSEYSVLACLI